MLFDPTEPEIGKDDFPSQDWSRSIYGELNQEQPPNIPKLLRQEFRIQVYVDSDYASKSSLGDQGQVLLSSWTMLQSIG